MLHYPGKLIVIDGTDGVGKTTQVKELINLLRKEGYSVKTFSFPDYESRAGKQIGSILRGEQGELDSIDPRRFALLFAQDRLYYRKRIRNALSQGKIVVLDRYIASNAYQAARMNSSFAQKQFLKWIFKLEYKANQMPKEDLMIYLSAPVEVTQNLITGRSDKAYLKGRTRDINEENSEYQKKVHAILAKIYATHQNGCVIECSEKGTLLGIKEINALVMERVRKIL